MAEARPEVAAYLARRAAEVNRALEGCLPSEDTYPSLIHRAMAYSLLGGGKRLRPVLLLLAAEAVAGHQPPGAMACACAVEMLHSYTLVHDDLPAMDDDDLRRGRPTCHKVFGEAVAILAGDALLTQAFLVLVNGLAQGGSDLVAAGVRELALAAGSQGVIGGQVVDLQSEGQEVDLATVEYIHLHKTAALFAATLRLGGLIARAGEEVMGALGSCGRHLGLAFQIQDDLLDLLGDQLTLGKAVGADQRLAKATYPALVGVEVSRRRVATESSLAVAALSGLGDAAGRLRQVVTFLSGRDR